MTTRRFAAFAGLILLAPAAAHAQQVKLTPIVVFVDAAPSMKLLMLALIVATIAAIAVTVRKLTSGPHLTGGSTFLSSLRLGGPLVGLLGAAFNGLNGFIGIANVNQTLPLAVFAPGFAEAFALFTLGLIAGVVAVIGHGVVEARIDRAVLQT